MDQLDGRFVTREMTFVPDRLANLAVQALDGICGVDELSVLGGEGEERNDLPPLSAPVRDDLRVLLALRSLRKLPQIEDR